MRLILAKSILLFLTTFHLLHSQAQTFIGLQQSNYSGIHQASYNPALIATSRHRTYINGLTAGFGFYNDYIRLNLPFNYLNLITGNIPSQYTNSQGKLQFSDAWLSENNSERPKNGSLYFQTRGPGYMQKIGKGFAFGIQYKNNISFQINDVADPLARLARYGVDSSKGSFTYSGPNKFQIGTAYGDNSFTVNMNAYGEIGLTLAKTIIDKDELKINIGVTPKMLLGYGTGYIKNKGLMIKAPGVDTVIFGETDLEYGYTDIKQLTNINAINFNALTSKLNGKGFGYDAGVSFEYNPTGARHVTNGKNAYLFKGGVSLLDAGRITYNHNLKNTHLTNSGSEKTFVITDEFAKAWSNGQTRGLAYTDSVMRTIFNVDTSAKQVVSRLPTTLNFQFDYNVFKMFYVGANLSQDLRGKKSIGSRKASYLMVIPRFESKLFEISLPIGLMNDYTAGRMGVYLRIGPVFVGSDNLIGQIRSNNIYGADIYFGISTGITSKKNKAEDSGSVTE